MTCIVRAQASYLASCKETRVLAGRCGVLAAGVWSGVLKLSTDGSFTIENCLYLYGRLLCSFTDPFLVLVIIRNAARASDFGDLANILLFPEHSGSLSSLPSQGPDETVAKFRML